MLIKQKMKQENVNQILKKLLIVSIIIVIMISYIPIISFAEDDMEEEEQLYPAIVPAFADAIISKYVVNSFGGSTEGGTSTGNGIDPITDDSETGDGWESTTTVNYPNGTTRKFRNYRQWQGSYAGNPYWGQTIASAGCGPSCGAIILSGYGIDADPGDVVNSFHDMNYDYTSMQIIATVLEEKYGIESEVEAVSSSTTQHIKDNFDAGRPIIAGVDNHFVAYLGEDSQGNMILSDPGYTDGRNENTISGYVNSHSGYYVLLVKSDGNALASGSGSKKSSDKKSDSKSTSSSGSGEASVQVCDPSNGGYESIFTSGTTGRQFREFKQNTNYNYPEVYGTYWNQECSTVATGIVGSGYKNLTMQDMADKLNENGGVTYIDAFISDFTGQSIQASSVSSIDDFKNALSNGSVAVFHDWGYSGRGHYLAVLDISKDKSQVYVSNPDTYANGWDGMSTGWLSTDFVYGALDKGEIYFATDDGSAVDYTGDGSTGTKTLTEDKIFYIGDSWMVGLNGSGKAKSPSSYFYAQGGKNANWVLSTYTDMRIPNDASCIVVEFGLNGLNRSSWEDTQELVDKLVEDYSGKEIFVLQTPHICDGYTVDPNFNSKVDDYNNHMREYCEGKEGATFINPTTNIVSEVGRGYLKNEYAANPNDTSQGGGKVHLNIDGLEVWYEDIIKCIQEHITFGTGASKIDMSKNIIEREDGFGYKINIDLDAEVENLLYQLQERGYHLENYLSSKHQHEYLKNMIKAVIVTQYPDLRAAEDIADDFFLDDNEVQGCIKIKRYSDEETDAFASGYLTNPKDKNDEDEGMYLAYMPYDEFTDMISNSDKDALNYFTMDSSNNIVVAGWETMEVSVDGPNQTNVGEVQEGVTVGEIEGPQYTPKQTPYSKLTTKKIDYLNQVSNYLMPFNLMWSMLVYGHNDEFANDLAKLVIDTDIVIGCFDATNTKVSTYEQTYEIKDTISIMTNQGTGSESSAGAGEKTVTLVYKFEVTEVDTLKTDTPSLKVIYADSWTAVYNNNYKIKKDTKTEEETVELEDEKIGEDSYLKRGDRYVGDHKPEREDESELIEKTIDEDMDEIIDSQIEKSREEVESENAKIEYKYEALQEKVTEYYDNTDLGKFLSKKDVQSNVINMITRDDSRKNIEAVFNEENYLMVKYAKEVSKTGYKKILSDAVDAVDKKLKTDEDLYNKITKDGEDKKLARTYKVEITSITIQKETKKAEQEETITEETTTATLEETPGNTRWKTDKTAKENSFVKILSNNSEAKTNLHGVSGWLFESMEKTASIADLVDLIKMLFQYVYEGSDYGISEEDEKALLDLFDPEKMATFKSKTTSGGTVVGGASYSSLTLTNDDMTVLYKLVQAEGGGGTHDQVMYIACTVLNRVLSSSFPNSVSEVAFAPGQFEVTWNGMYDAAVPTQDTKDAVDDAIKTGDTTGGSIGFQNDWLYDSTYPGQTYETPIELLRETWPYGGVVVFYTTASIQAELSQY